MAGSNRFASQRRVSLTGSERKPYPGESERTLGVAGRGTTATAPTGKDITVSVVVPPKAPYKMKEGPQERLSRATYAERHGANPASVELLQSFATEYGLSAEPTEQPGRCTVHLTGSVDAMQQAFGVSLAVHTTASGKSFRVREGAITIPESLNGHVVAVLGLDDRPQAQPHFRIAHPRATNVSYTPLQVAQLYGFPAGATASRQTIGLIELGGGYSTADLATYFQSLGLPAPTVTTVSVDGGTNAPGTSADGEVMLDIEVAASVATGAKVVVYFTPNTDQGFTDAISTAVHDTVNKPSVISISWGGPEPDWTTQATTAMDAACEAAAALGVTIVVACGDNGSTDGVSGTTNYVDFPASSPHVLACGGTKLVGSGSTIESEVVWNELALGEGATGGGVSDLFPLPSWQQNSNVPAPTTSGGGRGVPDVAGDADPSTGYTVDVDGQTQVIGGTSAVAPLWAALIALSNEQNGGTAGFVNPTLYGNNAGSAFHDITQGTNGGFSAGPGWDACSGQGSPSGAAIIQLLAATTTPAK